MNRFLLSALLLSSAVPPLGADSTVAGTIPAGPKTVRINLRAAAASANTGINSGYRILASSDAVEIPVSPVTPDDEGFCHALTVVFDDNGDGGPVVEWIAGSGERTLLSPGLGSIGTGNGIERRTLLLPQNLTLAGGRVSVSFAGRLDRIRVIELRPCAELAVAAPLGGDLPAMLDQTGRALSEKEVSGTDAPLLRGDSAKGNVVRAELSATPLPITENASVEVVVPMPRGAGESFVKAEVSGLDPSSRIGVTLNGIQVGSLGMESFPLDDPGTLRSPAGRLLRAGWRTGSLFVPAGLWKQGDNSVVFALNRAAGDSGAPVRLRNAVTEILFGEKDASARSGDLPMDAPAPSEPLSNGSVYGNPSPSLFHATLPPPLARDAAASVGP